jgi:hypothetical protein
MAKTAQLHVRVDSDVIQAFKEKTTDEGRTMSELVEQWIIGYLSVGVPATRDQINAIGRTVTEAAEAGIALDDLRAVCPDNFDAALAAFMDTGYGRIDGDRVYLVPGGNND